MAAKKKPTVQTRRTLDEIVDAFNKDQGVPVVVRGAEMKDQEIMRCTSGNLAFDVMLGGGWALNQWHEIIGDESSGKTALALKTVAANMAIDPEYTCLWIAAESFVPEYAEAIGVDLTRMVVVEHNVMEDVYTIVLDAMDDRAVDIVVVDSLPALIGKDEEEKSMDEFVVGVGARLTGKFLRKSGKAQKRSLVDEDRPVLGLMINQWREKIGVMYGDPRTTPGGRAKNYHYFTRVEVKRDEWIVDSHKDKVGQTIVCTTRKNKSARPGLVAMVDFYFAKHGDFTTGQFDTLKQVVLMGVGADLITRAGAFYTYGTERWQGMDKLVAGIRDNPKLYTKLYRDVFKHYLPDVTPPEIVLPQAATTSVKRRVKRALK